MANINHSTLSDPYLHEPKGISSALAGQIYVSDGAGSGDWVECKRNFNGYLTFSPSSPYAHSTTTSDTVLNPSFNVATNNGFTGLSSPNARVRYDGVEDIIASLAARFSVKHSSGLSKDIELVFYKNGVEILGSRMIVTTAASEWKLISILADTALSTNDYIEVLIKADAAATINFASGILVIVGMPEK